MSEAIKDAIAVLDDVLLTHNHDISDELEFKIVGARNKLEALLPQLERIAVYGIPANRTNPGVDIPWIKWEGGFCPVSSTARVEVCYRGDTLFNPNHYHDSGHQASAYTWLHYQNEGDIVAYRVLP